MAEGRAQSRWEKLVGDLDIAHLHGAEIGPLASPIVARADGPILYIDHVDTNTLKLKYAADPAVDTAAIVEVDAVWDERTLQAALGPERRLDYVIASHVVEHTPDLVSWLAELTSVLAPGGSLRLAVPDKRFCFDYLRRETQLSDILAAYYNNARRPQVHEVIDSEIHHLHMDLGAAWRGDLDTEKLLGPDQLDRAFAFADRAQGEYVDVHCWTFTLSSFASIMRQLGNLELTSLACRESYDTEVHDNEFIVILSTASQTDVVESWTKVWRETAGPLVEVADGWPKARQRWLQRGNETVYADMQAEIAALRQEVSDLRNSTSWRITHPLRAAVKRLRGR